MTDLRDLITELADELDHNRQCLLDDRRVTHPLADKARAALAEPEAPINWAAYFVRQAVVQEQELKAAMSQPEPERLTVQEISNLPQHWKNYIAEDLDDEIVLDGRFFRADLQQLADSIPNNRSNSNA
jgi:hypothetical protein